MTAHLIVARTRQAGQRNTLGINCDLLRPVVGLRSDVVGVVPHMAWISKPLRFLQLAASAVSVRQRLALPRAPHGSSGQRHAAIESAREPRRRATFVVCAACPKASWVWTSDHSVVRLARKFAPKSFPAVPTRARPIESGRRCRTRQEEGAASGPAGPAVLSSRD